jgi:hypothetical protein
MRQFRILCATAFIAATVFTAASPMQAAPFHVIRYTDTGFCQVWDNGMPIGPWPTHYTVMTHRQPTLQRAVAVKDYLLRKHYCSL